MIELINLLFYNYKMLISQVIGALENGKMSIN